MSYTAIFFNLSIPMIRFFYVTGFILLISGLHSAEAQRTITTEAGATHRIYSPEDGIPSHSPTNAFVTRDGYIWMSTTGGTVRISGNEIEDFGTEYGLNMMQHIYYDRNGDIIWFTDSEVLASFDGNEVKLYGQDDGFNPPGGARRQVTPMLTDSQGRLWIGSYSPPFDSPYNGGLLMHQDGEFKTFTPEELPLHNISGIFESSDGSLWFTSQGYQTDGIFQNHSMAARYSDDEFEIFGPETGCSNIATRFRDPDGFTVLITEGSNGSLWFYCNGSYNSNTEERENFGLFTFDGELFQPVSTINELLTGNNYIQDIFFIGENDDLYVTIFNPNGHPPEDIHESVYVYSNGEWRVEEITTPHFLESMTSHYFDNDLQYLGFYFSHLADGKLIANLQMIDTVTNSIHSIIFRKEESEWHWIDITPGFFIMNLTGDVFLTVQAEPDVFGIYIPPFSRLLTGEDGLLKLPVESTTGGGYYRPRFLTDSEGNIWINYLNSWDPETETWDAAGTSMWDGEHFNTFTVEHGFSSNNLNFAEESSDGSLWFPSDMGLNRWIYTEDGFSITTYPDSDGNPFYSSKVVERDNGEIFTYTNYIGPISDQRPDIPFFLGRLQGSSVERFETPFPDSLTSLPYQDYEMFADRENRLWLYGRFSNTSNGLFLAHSHLRIFENETWSQPPADWNFPETRLFYVGELENGRYYIVDGGFWKFDFDRKQYVDLSDSTNANADFRILKRVNTSNLFFNIESENHLYIRFSDMGIAIFDGTNLTYLDRRDGLPSLRISYPHRDLNDDILFTTPTGGVIFSGTDFIAVRDDAVSGVSARGIARDKNNNILIQHLDTGITITQLDTTRHPVRISSIIADTNRYYENQSPRLSAGQNNIQFRFNTLNFINPDDVKYSYFLEGFDSDWSQPTTANFMEFRNLSPGNYTFRVRGVGPGTVISEASAFSFVINPPWWQTWWAYLIYFIFFISGVVLVDRVQRRRIAIKAREKEREKELKHAREIEKAYQDLAIAHENLKAAQEQLVQQEKLASLGQLTAGIAHEIKNPLNFVNNFSELSLELVEEVREELRQKMSDRRLINSPFEGSTEEERKRGISGEAQVNGLIFETLNDIETNIRKIHQHGSRADSIVKSMLMHSRGNNGQMEPTDLNSLIKEYVNLAFHGMRAGKEPINVDIDLQLDDSIKEVPLIAEDFSRVILNVCNNAFDAMREKISENAKGKRQKSPFEGGSERSEQGDDLSLSYHPKLMVRTHHTDKAITIEIEDNGPGIPDEIKDKILQPFFTTKKGTNGTGLGLSITNDIVTAHGGTLTINTLEGEGSTFTITLN
jgi:signal transduction histidine kinase